jgi:hypothetical protein
LALMEGEPNGHNDPAPPAAPARAAAANPLDVAADWYKADDHATAPAAGGASPDQLLDSVLPSKGAARPKLLAGTAADHRKAQEESVAQLKAELAQLQGACVPAKP